MQYVQCAKYIVRVCSIQVGQTISIREILKNKIRLLSSQEIKRQ